MKKILSRGQALRLRSGQALVEILVALGIAVIVIVALVSVVVTSVSNSTFAKTQGEANRYSREANEWIRSERDRNWNAFSARTGSIWCLSTLTWPSSAGACSTTSTIPNTSLRRETTLTLMSANQIDVTARVYWADPKGNHEVRLNSRLTKWR